MSFEEANFPLMFAAVAGFLILARWGCELWLSLLNARHVRRLSGEIPEAFRETMDPETHRKSVEYTLAKHRFGVGQDTCGTLVLLAVLFSGALPWLFGLFQGGLGDGAWGSALTLIGIGLLLSLPGLPWDWAEQFRLEARFGFNTMTPGTWMLDRVKGLAIALLLGTPLLAAMLKLVTVAGDLWWLWAFVVMVAFQILMMVVAPVLILPLFNKFTPLPDGSLKKRLLALAQRTGFQARNIQVMDGSRRSKHSNAFFTGVGRFRKIVLFDTLIDQLRETELEAVLAHEIGHYRLRHIPKLLAASVAGLFVSFAALGWLSRREWFYTAFGFDGADVTPAFLLFALLSGTVTFWLGPLFNRVSRRHEYEADAFAKAAVNDEAPLIGALRKLSGKNLSNPTPHPVYSAFHHSHPTLPEREQAMRTPAAVTLG